MPTPVVEVTTAQAVRVERAVTLRSVLLGLVGVCFICALAPFNDYVANNTNLIGNHLPIGLLVFFFLFVMAINVPLRKWFPKRSFRSNELAVALGMTLVSCALPTSGLMRYLPGHLTGFWEYTSQSKMYADFMQKVDPPDWMFPKFKSKDPWLRGNEPVARDFKLRAATDTDTFKDHFRAVPWSLWRMPALTWGLFLAFLFGTVICMTVIFRHQWVENERLPFPLATIQLSLIESPRAGSLVNSLFANRGFWIAFAFVFAYRAFGALHKYYPRYWPDLRFDFDLEFLLRGTPLMHTDPDFRYSRLFFTIIGITFFLQTKVSFSVWFFYVAVQLFQAWVSDYNLQVTAPMRDDQMLGAMIPFALAAVWVGRRHLLTVMKQMFRAPRADEVRGRYLPYSLAGWGFVACFLGMNGWLIAAGASLLGALVISSMIVMVFLCVSRIVASTGMLYVMLTVPIVQPWVQLLHWFGLRTTLRSFFYSNWFGSLFVDDTREALPVFAMHAMRVADETAYSNERNWKKVISFTLCLVLALAVAYVVSGASMLYCEYTYFSTLSHPPVSPINYAGAHYEALKTLHFSKDYLQPHGGFQSTHSHLGHFLFGAGLTGILSVLRLRYDWWPLNPVGFLLAYWYGIGQVWMSVVIGWLLKLIIVRFGGSQMFATMKPIMIGLILGEASAGAFWLVVSLVRLAMGLPYQAIQIMPV